MEPLVYGGVGGSSSSSRSLLIQMITIPEGKIDSTEKLGPNHYGTRYETAAALEEVVMEEAAVSIEGPIFCSKLSVIVAFRPTNIAVCPTLSSWKESEVATVPTESD